MISHITKPSSKNTIRTNTNSWKESLQELIIDKAREVIQSEYRFYKEFEILHEPLEEWQHVHFGHLSTLLDISVTTLKRLFSVYHSTPTQKRLSGNTEKKVKAFLECEDLDKLIQNYRKA